MNEQDYIYKQNKILKKIAEDHAMHSFACYDYPDEGCICGLEKLQEEFKKLQNEAGR